MEISNIITALVVGAIIGALARLVVPGKQSIGIIVTILLGIVGAFIGGFIGAAIADNFIIVFLCQVVVAAVLVAIVGGTSRRGARA
jgi:uncharacterized membrane protein YeaQ/YmgE (transglycosylase-associated protein family)